MVNDLKFENDVWEVWVFVEDAKENLLIIQENEKWDIIRGMVKDREACVDGALRVLREAFGVGTLKIELLFDYTIDGVRKFIFRSRSHSTSNRSLNLEGFNNYRWEEPCNIVNYDLDAEFRLVVERYYNKLL